MIARAKTLIPQPKWTPRCNALLPRPPRVRNSSAKTPLCTLARTLCMWDALWQRLRASGAWDELVENARADAPRVAAVPAAAAPAAAKPTAMLPEPAAPLTPIAEVIERASKRPGDGRQYGQHGTCGAYREGMKAMGKRIADGEVPGVRQGTARDGWRQGSEVGSPEQQDWLMAAARATAATPLALTMAAGLPQRWRLLWLLMPELAWLMLLDSGPKGGAMDTTWRGVLSG